MRAFRRLPLKTRTLILIVGAAAAGLAGYAGVLLFGSNLSDSNRYIGQWVTDPLSRPQLITNRQRCQSAPFILPSEGFIGLLWNDPARPYTLFHPHSGVDIFGDGSPDTVPVYAVYNGYLTRLPEWIASVIIEHDDPLRPGEKVWSYYTHMASEDGSKSFIAGDFPPGTTHVPVTQGTLLGYQGEYSGTGPPIAMHVHISLVKSDVDGGFLNETWVGNTLDPSPYFNLPLRFGQAASRPIRCSS